MIGLLVGMAFLAGGLFGPAAAIACFSASLLLAVVTRENRFALVLLPMICLLGAWRVEQVAVEPGRAFQPGVGIVSGSVITSPNPAFDRQRFVLKTESLSGGSLLICVDAPAAPEVTLGGTVQFPATFSLVGDDDQQAARVAHAQGCLNLAETDEMTILAGPAGFDRARVWIQTRIERSFQTGAPGDAGALLTGFVTGDDSALSWEAASAFVGTGTSHLTAVSGSNFAILVLLATIVTVGPGSRTRLRWIGAVGAMIWSYAWLVEFSPSALRAALMATMVILALRFGRIPDLLTIAFLSGSLQIALRPTDADSLAFRLSLVSTIALVLVFSRSSWANTRSVATSFFIVAVVAHLATIPILVGAFGVVPVATVPANLLVSPLVYVTFPMAMVGAGVSLISATLGSAMAVPLGAPAGLIVAVVETVDGVFPARLQVGSPGPVTVTLVFLATWSLIILMSDDARNHFSRLGWWVRVAPDSDRRLLASFAVSAIAATLVILVWR